MQRKNLWAPWRMEYIQALSGDGDECFLCKYREAKDDQTNLVLMRSEYCMVVFNRFPYNNGHLLIAPYEHIGDMENISDECMFDMLKTVKKCQSALKQAIKPHGFNIGVNIGSCAGAGLPGHLHIHIVPRWNGDTNFMAVCGQTDVVSQSMKELYEKLKPLLTDV